MRQIYSLYEVTQSIKKVIQNAFTGYYWIKAELIKLNYFPKSGHCYPDLAENENGKLKAQIRANIWASHYIKIKNKFKKETGDELRDGMSILFLARVAYHEVYGLSLNIIDIDPSFTLGAMALEKKETLKRLREEGIFQNNKNLSFPLIPKRIAVISVESSKGFNDFIEIINNNSHGFFLEHTLFQAYLQGEGAVRSITEQIRKISEASENFDVVCIVRGGGGDVGLNAYNNYQLARAIALCPLPVIAGIGHSTNETIVEMIAYANAITPTDAAYFLLDFFINYEERFNDAREKLIRFTKERLSYEKGFSDNLTDTFLKLIEKYITAQQYLLSHLQNSIVSITNTRMLQKRNELGRTAERMEIFTKQKIKNKKTITDTTLSNLKRAISLFIRNNKTFLENKDKNLQHLKPENVLKRGFSITLVGGKALQSSDKVKKGDIIQTILYQGKLTSEVIKKQSR